MLNWDLEELLSMGLPDLSQFVTIVINGFLMAIRLVEAHVRQKTTDRKHRLKNSRNT